MASASGPPKKKMKQINLMGSLTAKRSTFKLFVYEVVMAEMDDNRLPDELFIGSTFRNDLNCYTVEERLKEMNEIIRIKHWRMEKFEKDSAEELALLQQLMNVMKEDNQLKRELLGCTDTDASRVIKSVVKDKRGHLKLGKGTIEMAAYSLHENLQNKKNLLNIIRYVRRKQQEFIQQLEGQAYEIILESSQDKQTEIEKENAELVKEVGILEDKCNLSECLQFRYNQILENLIQDDLRLPHKVASIDAELIEHKKELKDLTEMSREIDIECRKFKHEMEDMKKKTKKVSLERGKEFESVLGKLKDLRQVEQKWTEPLCVRTKDEAVEVLDRHQQQLIVDLLETNSKFGSGIMDCTKSQKSTDILENFISENDILERKRLLIEQKWQEFLKSRDDLKISRDCKDRMENDNRARAANNEELEMMMGRLLETSEITESKMKNKLDLNTSILLLVDQTISAIIMKLQRSGHVTGCEEAGNKCPAECVDKMASLDRMLTSLVKKLETMAGSLERSNYRTSSRMTNQDDRFLCRIVRSMTAAGKLEKGKEMNLQKRK